MHGRVIHVGLPCVRLHKPIACCVLTYMVTVDLPVGTTSNPIRRQPAPHHPAALTHLLEKGPHLTASARVHVHEQTDAGALLGMVSQDRQMHILRTPQVHP